jgi:hypothetical protein
MTNHTAALDIGAKLWSLCHVLRDDGVTYHQYLSELTYLLFLKMMKDAPGGKLISFISKQRSNAPQGKGSRSSSTIGTPPSPSARRTRLWPISTLPSAGIC